MMEIEKHFVCEAAPLHCAAVLWENNALDLQLRDGPPSCVSERVDPPASCDEAQLELTDSHTHTSLAAGCARLTYGLPGLMNAA